MRLESGALHERDSDQGGEDGPVVGQVEGDFDGVLLRDELEGRAVVPHVISSQLVHSLLLLPATSRDAAVHDLDHEGPHGGGGGGAWVRVELLLLRGSEISHTGNFESEATTTTTTKTTKTSFELPPKKVLLEFQPFSKKVFFEKEIHKKF